MKIAIVGRGIFGLALSYLLPSVREDIEVCYYVPSKNPSLKHDILGEQLYSEKLLTSIGVNIIHYNNINYNIVERKIKADASEEKYDIIIFSSTVKLNTKANILKGLNTYTLSYATLKGKELRYEKSEKEYFVEPEIWNMIVNELHKRRVKIAEGKRGSSIKIDSPIDIKILDAVPENFELYKNVYIGGEGLPYIDKPSGKTFKLYMPSEAYRHAWILTLKIALGVNIPLNTTRINVATLGDKILYSIGYPLKTFKRVKSIRLKTEKEHTKIIFDQKGRILGVSIVGTIETLPLIYKLAETNNEKNILHILKTPWITVPFKLKIRNNIILLFESIIRKIISEPYELIRTSKDTQ